MDLPPGRPHRLFMARVVSYVGFGVIMLVTVPRAEGAGPPPRVGVRAPAGLTEPFASGYAAEPADDRELGDAYELVREERGENRTPSSTDGIPLHLEGILCHAASAFSLLFSMMP